MKGLMDFVGLIIIIPLFIFVFVLEHIIEIIIIGMLVAGFTGMFSKVDYTSVSQETNKTEITTEQW